DARIRLREADLAGEDGVVEERRELRLRPRLGDVGRAGADHAGPYPAAAQLADRLHGARARDERAPRVVAPQLEEIVDRPVVDAELRAHATEELGERPGLAAGPEPGVDLGETVGLDGEAAD